MSHTENPDEHSLTLARGVMMRFRRIEPGEFRMGARGEYPDEEPIHRVRITRPFYLGIYPVTQAQFAVWTKRKRMEHQNHFSGEGRQNHPAEQLNWDEATQFCDWLNEEFPTRLPTGFVATLPTEAQWEYACRAGTETEYHTGDGAAALARAGWHEGNSENSSHPLGMKQANDWGLHDMHGNVWEWCRDAWDVHSYQHRIDGVADPEVTPADVDSENPSRVLRGGSWVDSARVCRSAFRYRWWSGNRIRGSGFRVCLVPCLAPAQSTGNRRSRLPETKAEGRGRESEAVGGVGEG